jgi:lipoprotein-anchoring transpeptidase ErfK/SrfK
VFTFDPRSEAYAYVELDALAPATRPSDDYFDPATAVPDQTLALPGRVVGSAAGRGHNQPVTVIEQTAGRGFRIAEDVYVAANSVRVPNLPQRTFPGRWIDANLTEPVLVTAYEGERPVFSGMAVKGVIGFQTPTGVFRILRRVANETMDSLTLGIPRTSPHGYYLRNVLYTQYFTGDGAAIHYNYWLARWGYGGSHGCLGMNLDDSRFLWDFAEVGTPVFIHY